jgi:hypothetical protein
MMWLLKKKKRMSVYDEDLPLYFFNENVSSINFILEFGR